MSSATHAESLEALRQHAHRRGIADAEFATVEELERELARVPDEPRLWPAPINLGELMRQAPTQPRMLIDDWLPAGYATLFAGHGGAGKSSIAIHLACCLATGRPWWGLHAAMRRVLYLSCEDRADVLHWRLAHISQLEELSGDDLAGLNIVDLVGHPSILYRRDPQLGLNVTTSYAELERLMAETQAEVLIIDGASDTYGANENDRAEVKEFVKRLVRLVGLTGAVIIVAHVNKPTASGGSTAEGYSGSTQWHNAVRARWYLYPEIDRTDEGAERTGRLTLALQKSNLGRDDQALTFQWDDEARLFVAERGPSRMDRFVRDQEEQCGIRQALRDVSGRGDYCPAAMQGPRTAYHVLSAVEAFPESLKGGSRGARKRFSRHREQLRANSIVREGTIRRAGRYPVATIELAGPEG